MAPWGVTGTVTLSFSKTVSWVGCSSSWVVTLTVMTISSFPLRIGGGGGQS